MTDPPRKPYPPASMCWHQRRPNPSPRQKENRDDSKDMRRVNFRENRENDHTQCQFYFRQLSAKVRELEERLARQEEKAVSKDYFKRIITKLVSNISRLSNYQSPTRVSNQNKPEKHQRQESRRDSYYCHSPNRDSHKYNYESQKDRYNYPYEKRHQKYNVHPVLLGTPNVTRVPAERDGKPEPRPPSPSRLSQNFWKWGGDILKPGIDLKNRIILMLEETLNNLKRSKDKTQEDDMKTFVDDFTRNLFKTVEESPREQHGDTTRTRTAARGNKKRGKPVNVSYMNPSMAKWQDSENSVICESSELNSFIETNNENITEYYKCEFIHTIMNTRKEDRYKLWQSILQEATANKQTKDDKVTIQIPDNDISSLNIHIEYTIGDLEHLLTGKRT